MALIKIFFCLLFSLWLGACAVTGPKFIDVVQKGDLEMVAQYIEKGADVNTFIQPDDYYGETDEQCQIPLSCAANRGYYEIAKLLIEKGADVNALNGNGVPPLFTALYGKKLKMVELLIENNADINFTSNDPRDRVQHNALTLAASNGDFLSFKLLIERDINIDYQNFYGYSAMSEAIKIKNEAMVNYLVSKNADLTLVDKNLCNYLCLSAKANDTILIQKFLKLGLPLEKPDFQGYTPLMVAILNKSPQAAKYLIHQGANVTVKDGFGNTTIQLAAKAGLSDVVELLVHAGADSRFKKQLPKAVQKDTSEALVSDSTLIPDQSETSPELAEPVDQEGLPQKSSVVDTAINIDTNSVAEEPLTAPETTTPLPQNNPETISDTSEVGEQPPEPSSE